MQKFKTGYIMKQTGLARSSVARLASKGRIPGAIRADGVHFVFSGTPEFMEWLDSMRGRRFLSVEPRPGGRDFWVAADYGDALVAKLHAMESREDAQWLAEQLRNQIDGFLKQSSKPSPTLRASRKTIYRPAPT